MKIKKERKRIKEKLNNYLLKLLSFRPRSIFEAKLKLKYYLSKQRIGENEDLIELLLKEAQSNKLLNDYRFAYWWVEQRTIFSPRGKRLLLQELKNKGVDEKTIERAIEDCWKEEKDELGIKKERVIEQELANKVAAKKINAPEQKVVKYLLSQGFTFEQAKKAAKLCQTKIKN